MRKLIVGLFCIGSLIVGFVDAKTSNVSSKKIDRADIVSVFGVDNLAIDPAYKGSGVEDALLYIAVDRGSTYAIEYRSFDGKLVREIQIAKGKGPGEIQYLTGVKSTVDTIYVFDYALKKIEMFTKDGEYKDSIVLTDAITALDFTVLGTTFVFQDSVTQELITVDTTGKIINRYPLSSKKKHTHAGQYFGGCMFADAHSSTLYFGMSSYPYRITGFNNVLREKKKIALKLRRTYSVAENFSPPEWNGMSQPHGYFMVTALSATEGHLYASFGAGYTFGKKMEMLPIDNEIHVFDKKTSKLTNIIWNEKLKSSSAGYSLVGVTKDYIVLSAVSIFDKELLKGIVPDHTAHKIWFIVLRNPVK